MAERGETVRVAAIFEPGREVRPVWFERNRYRHRVVATTYRWHSRSGDAQLLHFAVSDGEALFELIYNPQERSWTVKNQQAAP